jgi:hypothetical protein
MPVIPDLSAPSVPTDFTWTAKEGEVAFDDTLDRFE